MFVTIGTHIEDPVERLGHVRDATSAAKQMANAVGADSMLRYNEFMPAAVSNLAQRLTTEFARAQPGGAGFQLLHHQCARPPKCRSTPWAAKR